MPGMVMMIFEEDEGSGVFSRPGNPKADVGY